MDQTLTNRRLHAGKDNHGVRPLTTRLVTLGTLSLLSLTTFAAEQTAPHVDSWHGWHTHGHEFWWIFPLIMMFIFFFFFFSRDRGGCGWCRPWWRRHDHPKSRYTREDNQDATSDSALDILNKRYARGEIEKEEYEEKKATIISSSG